MTHRRLMLFAPSAYSLGGVATWISYLLPGLSARGWRPTLALTQGRWHDPAAYLTKHPYSPVVTVPCGTGTQASRVGAAARVIGAHGPDIVAVVNVPDVLIAAAELRRRGGFSGRIVAIEHGFARESLMDLRALRPALDAFVGVNRLTCGLARDFAGFSASRVYYAPCGVAPAASPGRGARGSCETLTLLYAGRLDAEQKRVHDLPALALELARRQVAFRLLIAGGGPEEAALRSGLSQTGADVQFLGVVDQQALCETIAPQADALLVLSSWETGPIVAWEAMAAGVPVICSRYVGSGAERALVDGENCLMFPVGDMRAAADAIARLRDEPLATRLSRGGSALAATRYSREVSIASWDATFRQIVAAAPLAPAPLDETLRPAGRLDHWLGAKAGDAVRGALGLAYRHTEPGGEWPHLLSRSEAERERFDSLVAACEARTA